MSMRLAIETAEECAGVNVINGFAADACQVIELGKA
jgi:hypothetical protein